MVTVVRLSVHLAYGHRSLPHIPDHVLTRAAEIPMASSYYKPLLHRTPSGSYWLEALLSVLKCQQTSNHLFLKCEDRKSTRLNSSHVSISYAVFCLKKKKKRR